LEEIYLFNNRHLRETDWRDLAWKIPRVSPSLANAVDAARAHAGSQLHILPSRGKYSSASNDWQVGVDHIYSDSANPTALWYSLPDVVASVILTGNVPKIVDAFRLKAVGKTHGLNPVSLRGNIQVDPRREDFFRVVIEEPSGSPRVVIWSRPKIGIL
jgi:hypothetical protein